MELVVFGLNHKTAPVEIRERLSFKESELEKAVRKLKERGIINEAVILSTCNRVEVYASGESAAKVIASIKDFIMEFHSLEFKEDEHHYIFNNRDCVRHLFSVVSGLDSMVIGETEILGQVKRSYELAHKAGTTGKLLNFLFQKSFKVAKWVRTNTAITAGALSVGSVAVELAERIFENLSGKALMILGAGEMSEVTLKHLCAHGVASIVVSNRSYDRAVELAGKFNAEAVTLDEGLSRLADVDIVISATSSPHCIIKKDFVSQVMSKRRMRPIFFIDIAVPRDVEPSVNEIENVYLYNIDDLKALIDENLKEREKELQLGASAVDKEVGKFIALLNGELSRHGPAK